MGSVPQAWKVASIVTIYRKVMKQCVGIVFLSSKAGTIFGSILLNRLSTHITPEVVPETWCGFRGNRSTVDMIFCLRQLQEKCIEYDRPLYMVFVDFSKALIQLGGPGYVSYWGSMDAQRSSQLWSRLYIPEWWRMLVTDGVKQSCVLAPTLLSIFLSAMLNEVFRDMGDGVYV